MSNWTKEGIAKGLCGVKPDTAAEWLLRTVIPKAVQTERERCGNIVKSQMDCAVPVPNSMAVIEKLGHCFQLINVNQPHPISDIECLRLPTPDAETTVEPPRRTFEEWMSLKQSVPILARDILIAMVQSSEPIRDAPHAVEMAHALARAFVNYQDHPTHEQETAA